jgi:hypothetical protein
VAAPVAFGYFGLRCVVRFEGVAHWALPIGYFLVQSLRRKRDESGLSYLDLRFLKTRPGFWPGLVFSIYI